MKLGKATCPDNMLVDLLEELEDYETDKITTLLNDNHTTNTVEDTWKRPAADQKHVLGPDSRMRVDVEISSFKKERVASGNDACFLHTFSLSTVKLLCRN